MKPHFVEKDGITVAFFPDTLRFYEINKLTRNVMKDIIEGINKEHTMEQFSCDDKSYESLKKVIDENCNCGWGHNKKQNDKGVVNSGKEEVNILKKLVINITNVCNLACKYCYANGGNYCSEECMMSEDTIIKALDVFYGHYDNIENIQIFGGEPTLNPQGIEVIGKYVQEKFKDEEKEKTKLGMVSNGTVMDEKLLEIIKKYNIHVTVSLDGPESVNDKMRIFKNGKGTGRVVGDNIMRLRKFTGEPSCIESTYNRVHEEMGVKIKDIIKYGKEEFGIEHFHITPVSGNEDDEFILSNRDEFVKSVSDLMGENSGDIPINDLISTVINILKKKQVCKYLCEAGLVLLSVSVNGDVYPCFMLIDQQEYKMGNIYEDDLFLSKKYNEIKTKLINFSKFNDERCKNCFNNTICHGCIGSNYFETGNIHRQSEVNCEMHKRITEEVIVELVKKMRRSQQYTEVQ
ncbi:uncharacterized protein SAMN02745248_00921 [Hathewaya proteolytica DSM 3090]|uniref:Radical SAM core domain-containing protein n=1 Tax=Hathewaya proteolytica DSM 3090 TaxID=1121331 RepID=A0A1M6M2M2_9CLOT|nr:radical SAM protein [Hathewaya proteolytica]SHJ77731.1 uncharacterized protein SAMN02745248_00921 [Hathewaya proteolytica DSM 3090]